MVHIPSGETSDFQDPIHWTILCLTPTHFWQFPETYTISESPSLQAQALHYIAKALINVAQNWRVILEALDGLVGNGSVLHESHRLQDILFDDDAFSMSKRYFWAINVIHEIVNLLDDNIEKWTLYQKVAVKSFRKYTETTAEDWEEKAQATIKRAQQEATEACSELEFIRRAFQEKLERITVMRDGVSFCPMQWASVGDFTLYCGSANDLSALQCQRCYGKQSCYAFRRERQASHLREHILSASWFMCRKFPASIV